MSDYKPINLDCPEGTANRFLHPFRMTIVGQTMSGKSRLIKEILKYRNQLFTTHYDAIYYCLPGHLLLANEDFIKELKSVCPDIRILENEPPASLLRESKLPKLFIMGTQR